INTVIPAVISVFTSVPSSFKPNRFFQIMPNPRGKTGTPSRGKDGEKKILASSSPLGLVIYLPYTQ
ncbi:MAG: hypothetical protein OEM19_03975, partial [Deltaproteobacteria bacterium]|nr:hypothetical protein [Deltaproteobacteria bacterium]